MRISIKDIAKAAGVSHSTVSRALGDSPLVNPETKARLQRLAAAMGYSPDAAARGLVMGRTRTVGLVVTTIADPFIAEVVLGIESTAFEHNYTVILATSNAQPDREVAAVEMLRSKRVDGVIVTASRVGALYRDRLKQIGVPVVLLNNHSKHGGPYTFSVRVDDHHGGWLATKHLSSLGHRRIAYLGVGEPEHSSNAERHAGYCRALAEAGIASDPALHLAGNGRSDGGEAALVRLLELDALPTAAFCYNDMTAVGVLCAARELGVAIPQTLAVVGFDDIPLASFISPSLTTIAQPKFELGHKAMQMALSLMEPGAPGAREEVHDISLKGELIIRESTVGKAGMDASAWA